MRHKASIQLLLISLLMASGLLWVDQASGQASANAAPSSKKKIETPLSYEGRLAVSVANELYKQEKYTEALKQADDAVRSDPKSGSAHLARAFVLDKLGETRKASASFNKAIRLAPVNGYIRYAYANHLCRLQDYSAADENFLLAARDGSYPYADSAYGSAAECAYQAEQFDASEAHARAALAINRENSVALVTLAKIMHKRTRYFEARAFIQRREAVGQLDVALLQLAHQIEKSAGDDRAAASYQKQLDLISQAQIQPPTGEGQKKP